MGIAHRQAPIVGEEGCIHLDGEGYISVPLQGADIIDGGLSFALDCQTAEPVEQVVFCNRQADGVALGMTIHADNQRGRVRFEVGDAQGRAFIARAETSGSIGKRLLCTITPSQNELSVVELQPWASGQPADISIERAESPSLGSLDHPLVLGGLSEEGAESGSFVGRLAHFAIWDHPLDSSRVPDFRRSSISRPLEDLPTARPVSMDEEGRALFLDDYDRLVQFTGQGPLSRAETRDVSLIAFRWLCDRRPLLHRLADHYGAQISLPDLSPLRESHREITKDKPTFLFTLDRWEGDWLAPSAFLTDSTFWLGQAQRDVSWVAFIAFVRNKLGAGHFDPDDRKRWQKELKDLATETRVGAEQWLNVKMLSLAKALRFSVESCGFVSLARYGL